MLVTVGTSRSKTGRAAAAEKGKTQSSRWIGKNFTSFYEAGAASLKLTREETKIYTVLYTETAGSSINTEGGRGGGGGEPSEASAHVSVGFLPRQDLIQKS